MERVSDDQTLILKLSISRDIHSEFMRKLLGKAHYETVFGDHLLSSSVQCASYDHHTVPAQAESNKEHNSIMSVYEFCILCDNTPSPVPGSPSKRRSRSGSKTFSDNVRKTNSSMITDLNELHWGHGVQLDEFSSRSTLPSPGPVGHATDNKVRGFSKDFDGMIKLEGSSRNVSDEVACLNSTSGQASHAALHPSHHTHLLLNIASVSTKLDESLSSAFQLPVDQSMSSSLSTPTFGAEGSPILSRSGSQENLQQDQNKESSSVKPPGFARETSIGGTPEIRLQLVGSPPIESGTSSPFPNMVTTRQQHQQPIKAKRNPKIEKMISEVSNKSRSTSPKFFGGLSRSMSGSSSSFYEQTPTKDHGHILEGIAEKGEPSHVRPHSLPLKTSSSAKPKPFFSLFPVSHANPKKVPSSVLASSSRDVGVASYYNPAKSLNSSMNRLSQEEMISSRKAMARKMREFCKEMSAVKRST